MEFTVTPFEENLYNLHLKISRIKRNKPYSLRKKFDNLSDETYLFLTRLSTFFKKHKHILPEDFFTAPFVIYHDEEYFDLQYFTSLKAVKTYTLYQRHIQDMSPDSDEQLLRMQRSLKYILNFCRERKISLQEYFTQKNDSVPFFLLHLKEYHVNIYTLYGFKNFEQAFKSADAELVKFIVGEQIYEQMRISKIKFYGSKKARFFVEAGIKKINDILQQNS